MADKILARVKAVVAAVGAAAIAALAGVDWEVVILTALGLGTVVERTPNKNAE